jgi:hypothetical protein
MAGGSSKQGNNEELRCFHNSIELIPHRLKTPESMFSCGSVNAPVSLINEGSIV